MNNYMIEYLGNSHDDILFFKPLLQHSTFKPIRYLAKYSEIDLCNYWISSISKSLHQSGSKGFLARDDGKPLGLLIVSENPWESDIINIKAAVINVLVIDQSDQKKLQIASALLSHAIEYAKVRNIKFLMSKIYTDDLISIHALESHGFYLMESMVDVIFDYKRESVDNIDPPIVPKNIVLRSIEEIDRAKLVALAKLSFNDYFGRFNADERIGHGVALKVYEQWVHSSLDGYADWMLLAEVSGTIAGFCTWKWSLDHEKLFGVNVVHALIGGIHPDYRKIGIFSALNFAGMLAHQGKTHIINAPVHINNYGSQKALSNLHWRVIGDARHTFHKWIDN